MRAPRILAAAVLATVAGTAGAAPTETKPGGGVAPSVGHLLIEATPPFATMTLRNGSDIVPWSLGGVGLGFRSRGGLWAQGSRQALLGLEGTGWSASVVAGATIGQVAPSPGGWTLSTPLFVGYRHARRPNSRPSDGVRYLEIMNMALVGARESFTRWAAGGNAIELGVDLTLAVPLTRDEPPSGSYYQDGPTKTSTEVSLFFAWLVAL
jgi:hypothetical protein